MTSDFHKELQVLEDCEPLSKPVGARSDWLLDSTRRNSDNGETLQRSVKPLLSSFRPEDEVISQGISHAESASTSPAAQLQSRVCTRSSDSSNNNAALRRGPLGASNCSPGPGEDLEGTLITLEVSSSSLATEDVMPSATRIAPNRVRSLPLSSVKRRSSSKVSSVSGKRRKEQRPFKANVVTNLTEVHDPEEQSITADSLNLSRSIVKQSLSIASAHRAAATGSARRRRVIVQNDNAGFLSARSSGPVTPRNILASRRVQGLRVQSPSPAVPTREASVATVAAVQKEAAAAASGHRQQHRAYQSSPDIIVSSESEHEEISCAFLPHPRSVENRQREMQIPTQNGRNVLLTGNPASASASASASVAVLDVIEVTEQKTDQPSEDAAMKNGRPTLSHRFNNNVPYFPPGSELSRTKKASAPVFDNEDDSHDDVVSFSEMKRVAAEEEIRERNALRAQHERQNTDEARATVVVQRQVAGREAENQQLREAEQLRQEESERRRRRTGTGMEEAVSREQVGTPAQVPVLVHKASPSSQNALRTPSGVSSTAPPRPYVKQMPKAKCCTVM